MPTRYEYKVLPAVSKGLKAKGIKTLDARFAHALEVQINAEASEGWEYQRAEMLPSVERAGLTGSTTEWRNVLVFRRAIAEETTPSLLPPPDLEFEDEYEYEYEEEYAADLPAGQPAIAEPATGADANTGTSPADGPQDEVKPKP